MQAAVASWFVLRRLGERRGRILFPVGFPFRPALPCRKQRRVGVERRVGVGGGVQRLLGGGEKGSFCRSLASCTSSQPLTALDTGPRCLSSVQFSRSVVSDSLRPHESQHARPPRPSPTPGVQLRLTFIESVMPSSHLILCRPLLLLPPIPPSIRVFSNESTLRMRWPITSKILLLLLLK